MEINLFSFVEWLINLLICVNQFVRSRIKINDRLQIDAGNSNKCWSVYVLVRPGIYLNPIFIRDPEFNWETLVVNLLLEYSVLGYILSTWKFFLEHSKNSEKHLAVRLLLLYNALFSGNGII